jgi:hypothetical protein
VIAILVITISVWHVANVKLVIRYPGTTKSLCFTLVVVSLAINVNSLSHLTLVSGGVTKTVISISV